VNRKMRRLIELGVCKGNSKYPRSIRPAHMRMKGLPG